MAITGLGGVGKTQVALELAYQIREEYPDCSVFWIPSTSRESVEVAYLGASEKLGLKNLEGTDVKQRVRYHLGQESAGRWLLIFDNADDMDMWMKDDGDRRAPSALKTCIPESPQGFVLFTTRNRKLAVKLAASGVITIREMNEETAIHMLQKTLIEPGFLDDREPTIDLVQKLTCLPLAISQAAAYINENGLTVVDYVSLLDDEEEEVIDLLSEDFEDEWRYSDIRNPVATTWLISFKQIRQLNKLAAEYLSSMACVYPTDIPLSLLPAAPSLKRRTDALGLLSAYSFIDMQLKSQVLSLHRLVHLAIRNWLRREGSLSRYASEAYIRLDEAFPAANPEIRILWRGYLPHAQLILSHKECDVPAETREALLKRVGLCLQSDGRYDEAGPLFVELVSGRKERLGVEDEEVLRCTTLVASSYRSQGQWKEAEELEVEVMEKTKRVLGEEHPDTAAAMANLASTYSELGKWKEAKELKVQVLRIRKNALGPDDADIATALIELALSHWDLGEIDEAERLEVEVLELRKRILGNEHPDTLDVMAMHAFTNAGKGQLEEALALQIHVLEVEKPVLGKEHPATLTTMEHLALTYLKQRKWEEAVALEAEVLETRKIALGPAHPETLVAMSNLATTYGNQEKWEKAEELETQVLETAKRVLGEGHPNTLSMMSNLATTYGRNEQWMQAERLAKHVLDVRKRNWGEEHPDTLEAMAKLAFMYWSQGQWGDAEKLERQVLEARKTQLGAKHSDTLHITDSLIRTYISQSKWKEAEELAMPLLEIQKEIPGLDPSYTLRALTDVISIFEGQGRWNEAEEYKGLLAESESGTKSDS